MLEIEPRMNSKPEYYSGLGVHRDYIREEYLVTILNGLTTHFGEEAGKQFCQMIEDLPDLSPTIFLSNFHKFYDEGKVWKGHNGSTAIDCGSNPKTQDAVAIGTIIAGLPRPTPGDQLISSNGLKRKFFELIGQPHRVNEKAFINGQLVDVELGMM